MNFVEATVNSVNSIHTIYLLFSLTVTILVLYTLHPTPELEKLLIFCMGGFFTYINNAKT